MKTLHRILFCLSFSIIQGELFGQTSGCPSCIVNILNTNLSPGDFKARDEVRAQHNAEAHPAAGQIIHLYTDNSIPLDVEYQIDGVNQLDDEINSPLDFNLVVGKIEGSASVTPGGQATYNIPISLPPGTNGMIPTLGISYNSGATDGLVGRGWNISGLSAISMVPKDIYHDEETKGIQLDGTDAYALDGVRIIGSLEDGARLENDNFSQVKLDNGVFTVETKGGLVMEYGSENSTTNSRLMVSPPGGSPVALACYLSKVKDKYNNFILYKYLNQNGEIVISEIEYAGNTIKFSYDIREDQTVRYLLNNTITSSLLLRELKVECDGGFVKGYRFKYGKNVQTFLNEIIETGSDNKKLNSTLIKYGNRTPSPPFTQQNANITNITAHAPDCTDQESVVSDEYIFQQPTKVHFEINHIEHPHNPACLDPYETEVEIYVNGYIAHHFFSQDYSFDTYFDVGDIMFVDLSARWGASCDVTATIIDEEPNNISTVVPVSATGLLEKNADYISGDFNGDGKSDLVAFVYNSIGPNNIRDYTGVWKLYLNNDNGSQFTEYTQSNLGTDFIPYLQHFKCNENSLHRIEFTLSPVGFHVADFNKDGKDDILLANVNGNNAYRVYTLGGTSFSVWGHPLSMTQNTTFFLADIDGDGTAEGVKYYSSSLGTRQFVVFNFENDNSTFITYFNSSEFSGGFTPIDFNGDGIQELLTVRNGSWVVLSLHQNGQFTPWVSEEIYEDNFNIQSYRQAYFGDFNGDGNVDQIRMILDANVDAGFLRYGTGEETSGFTGFTTLGQVSNAPYENNSFFPMDINNDGKSDLVKMSFLNGVVRYLVYYGDHLSDQPVNLGFSRYGFSPNFDYAYEGLYPQTEFLLGDFDGDSRPDIFYKSNNNGGQRVISFINKGETDHLATAIRDGLGHKTEFAYKTLANGGSDVYVKDTGTPPENVINSQAPSYVVTQSTVPDGIGGTKTTNYHYEGAKIHLQGKGFLGFDKFSATNTLLDIKTENAFDLDETYYDRTLLTTKTFFPSNAIDPIAIETSTPVRVPTPGYPNAHFIKITDVVSEDFITDKTVTKQFIYDGDGNITYSSIEVPFNTNQTEKTEITKTYEHKGTWESTLGTPLLNVVHTCTTTVNRYGGGDAHTKKMTFEHDDVTGAITEIKEYPGEANGVTTTLAYYPTGALETKEISFTGTGNFTTCPTKTTTYFYDSKYRYIIMEDNPLGQRTETQYDPKWGVPISIKGIDGLTTRFYYDGFGRNIKTTSPDNLSTLTKLEWVEQGDMPLNDPLGINAFGLYSVTTTQAGSPTIKIYNDMLGRQLETESDGFNGTVFYSQKKYDVKGNLSQETGSYFATGGLDKLTTTYTYHDLDFPNMLWKIETSDGGSNPINLTEITYNYPGNGSVRVKTDPPDGKEIFKTTDATGKLTNILDYNNGTIVYAYWSNGKIKDITVNGSIANSMTYDDFANQTSMYDKDAGTTTYIYDAYNQLISQTDANSNIYNSFVYDQLGRIHSKTGLEGEYNYYYVGGGNGINLLEEQSVTYLAGGTYTSSYTYDALNRKKDFTQNINGEKIFSTAYEYDDFSRVSKTIYHGGFTINNSYTANGYLNEIKNGGTSLWHADEVNSLGQYSKYTLGNGKLSEITYNNFGFPEIVKADGGAVQHLEYNFDTKNGNLENRMDFTNGRNLVEEFVAYDNLNRLTTVDGPTDLSVSYYTDGTIEYKSDAGDYTSYAGNHPDGVSEITDPVNPGISTVNQIIAYTRFNSVESISELPNDLSITYGPEQQRVKTELNQGTGYTKYFHSNYEELTKGGHTYGINYIHSPTGLCALYITTDGGNGKMYYAYTDHLGSILKLTDENGITAEDDNGNLAEQSFDAWGRHRDADTWEVLSTPPSLPVWFYRGYTSHEHLPEFALINMNGRCYDPIVGMMLSPDNYLQDATSTTNYNRYAYCMNNPLKYSDPSGESFMSFLSDVFDIVFHPTTRIPTEGANYLSQRSSGNTGYAIDWNYVETGEMTNSWRNNPNVVRGGGGFPIGPDGREFTAFGDYGTDLDGYPVSDGFTDASGATQSSSELIEKGLTAIFNNDLPIDAQQQVNQNGPAFLLVDENDWSGKEQKDVNDDHTTGSVTVSAYLEEGSFIYFSGNDNPDEVTVTSGRNVLINQHKVGKEGLRLNYSKSIKRNKVDIVIRSGKGIYHNNKSNFYLWFDRTPQEMFPSDYAYELERHHKNSPIITPSFFFQMSWPWKKY